jgi:hypothetical protein
MHFPNQTWNRLKQVLEQFEDAWRRGENPDLDAFLAQAGPSVRPTFVVWRNADPRPVEIRLTPAQLFILAGMFRNGAGFISGGTPGGSR